MTTWNADDTALFARYGDAFVPRRREQISVVCALLDGLPSPAVLELACGEGILTAELLYTYPKLTITAVDASTAMLVAAQQRLAPFGERVRLVEADLADERWRVGTYGAVVTSLAVHHLNDVGKGALMRTVHGLLAPGGVYVQADLVSPATPVTTALAAEQWEGTVEYQSRAMYGGAEAYAAFRHSRWNTFRHPDPVDQPASVADQLRWLADAGFVDVDLPWAFAGHAILTAARPDPARRR
jgi:tRNA (cmo5U34)-methyltransferase